MRVLENLLLELLDLLAPFEALDRWYGFRPLECNLTEGAEGSDLIGERRKEIEGIHVDQRVQLKINSKMGSTMVAVPVAASIRFDSIANWR